MLRLTCKLKTDIANCNSKLQTRNCKPSPMYRNYLKIAFRNLVKYKFISFINLFGLTLGISCCLLILAYIINELSYDRYNKNADRIYRVTRSFGNTETGAVSLHLGAVAPPFAPLLKNDFKEIENTTTLLEVGRQPMQYQDKTFNESDGYFADEEFTDFFKVNVLRGNPKTALRDPYNIMLTEEVARKYFGSEEPMNKVIKFGSNKMSLKVSCIYKDLPANSHFHPKFMISFNTLKDTAVYGAEQLRTNWSNNSFYTYLMLPENIDVKKLEARFPGFLDKHVDGGGQNASKWTALSLQKLTDIHLRSHLDSELEENGDIKRVYIFSAIAFFILMIACINYMNLSTARSALRAREIGVRKVAGAHRKELIIQFLSESAVVSYMSMMLALGLTWLLMPLINTLSGQNLSMQMLGSFPLLAGIVVVPLVIGIFSGIYPALFMSSFRPVLVLKGLFKVGGGDISFRKVLVTLQFTISIILIISTGIIFRQMKYMQDKSLGFDREHIVLLTFPDPLVDKYDAFRNELLRNANVRNIGRSSRVPTGRLLDAMGAKVRRGDSLAPANADIKYVTADDDFISTYGVRIVAGRNFSREFGMDTSAFLVNEASVKALGFNSNADALGKDFAYGNRQGKLIGVFNDFNFESLHHNIVPLVLLMPGSAGNYRNLSIKISGNNVASALNHIEKTWRGFLPEVPYQYTFLDENFGRLYESEQKQKAILTVFACIAIFIACLGLFGLCAFAITQRMKEIGIRKVLGAGTATIVGLLSTNFLKLVGIAAVIAFPVAWFAMHNWLQDFAYRTTIPWWLFILAGILAGCIAFLTTGFLALRAARANPIKSLRNE